MEQPSISACMIVKNEEKLLPLCLRSIKDYVDEIVIVDTGSTDNTVSIGKLFGARMYHHPWEHNFSKHRNQSFGYARGDWILYIDADEELLPGSRKALREAVLADDDVDAITVVLECIFDEGGSIAHNNAIRVFRNHRGLRYKGRVHNYIVGVKKAICAPIHIFHHGYNLDKERMSRKFKRTTELLKKDIEEDPTNPRPHHFLSASYLSENMFTEAAEEALKAANLYEKRNALSHNYLWSLYIASSAHFHLGEIEKAESLAKKGVEVYPNHVDSYYMLALVAYAKKDRKIFEYHMKRYLETKHSFAKEPARFGELVHNTFGSEWLLYLFKGFFCMDEGDENKAQEELKRGRELCPDMVLYCTKLGTYFKLSGKLPQAEAQYLKALELRPEDTRAMWLISEVYEELGRTVDQITWLKKLVKLAPEFPNGQFALGLAHMRLGNLERAFALFRDVQAMDPENQEAKINEALCLGGMRRCEESIQVLKKVIASTDSQRLAVLSNLGHCYYETGERDLAIDSFHRMADLDSRALEPPVYLSMLLLENKDIEGCVTQCNQLLSLLGAQVNIVLNSVADLGEQYLKAGRLLVRSHGQSGLGKICFDISVMLGYNTPEAIAEIGATLIQAGETGAGVQLLGNAFSMAPQSRKVKTVVTEAIKHLEEMTVS
ncbi:MAG: glycosyltransferase [Deltaproteobacteria bacterium]|nr:glycosyltransferase [Deltaproteobacteria bacterium]